MSYGRTAPEGIPQPIWDAAIEEWMGDDTTIDSNQIKRIAKRMMAEQDRLGRVASTCLETAYGQTCRFSFQVKVF